MAIKLYIRVIFPSFPVSRLKIGACFEAFWEKPEIWEKPETLMDALFFLEIFRVSSGKHFHNFQPTLDGIGYKV
jgi:hypothetical protein